MFFTEEKLLVHISTNHINTYRLKDSTVTLTRTESVDFTEAYESGALLDQIDSFFANLFPNACDLNCESVRLYATGIFQNLTQDEQINLINQIYVNHGLYFNIIPPDLEQFYLDNGFPSHCGNNLIDGIVQQEFRKVVVCGSFQQHLNDIGEVMNVLEKRNIEVLSPWTTKIVPETLGTDFILLEGQEPLKNKRDAWTHKYIHMNKFRQSDAIIVCNPNGSVGKGTMFEFGFMIAYGKRIIFTERPTDLSIPFPYEVGLNFK